MHKKNVLKQNAKLTSVKQKMSLKQPVHFISQRNQMVKGPKLDDCVILDSGIID